jgi:hypothetical protein
MRQTRRRALRLSPDDAVDDQYSVPDTRSEQVDTWTWRSKFET